MSFLDSFDFMPSDMADALGGAVYGGGGEYPSFSFDVPQFDVAQYSDQLNQAYGAMPQFWDTTTERFVDPSGKPMEFGPVPPGYGADLNTAYGGGGGFGTPPRPGMFEKGGTFGQGGSVDQFAAGPIGRSLIPLLAGGGAMGLGRLLAGSPPRLNMPPFTPSASTQAGESALLNAYRQGVGTSLPQALQLGVAGQRDIAGNLVRDIGAETPYSDPVQVALQKELMSVLGGSGVSPTTTTRQAREMAATRAQLYQQLGPDYELTTAGQTALNQLAQRHNAEQFDERRATVSSYAPLEQSRAQFAYAAPTARTGQRQNILASIAPTQPMLNYGGIDRANLYNTQLQDQAALTGYQGETQNQRELAAGVGQLGGKIAESITRPPNPFDTYYRNLLSGAAATG